MKTLNDVCGFYDQSLVDLENSLTEEVTHTSDLYSYSINSKAAPTDFDKKNLLPLEEARLEKEAEERLALAEKRLKDAEKADILSRPNLADFAPLGRSIFG